jgi:hypothetical protein
MGQSLEVSSKVGAEQFEGYFWRGVGDGLNAPFVMVGATVREVVSVDDRDDGVSQVHRTHSLRKVIRFFGVQRRWPLDGSNGAKPTTPGAFLPGDHEGGITACPTLVDVGASGFLANGVEFVVFDGRFGAVEGGLLFAAWKAGAKPTGKSTRRWARGGRRRHREWFSFHLLAPLCKATKRSAKKVCWPTNYDLCSPAVYEAS